MAKTRRPDESSDPSWTHFDAPTARDAAALPERIGEYRIVREIGRGGMGVVFEAEQTSMQRRVALKVLSLAATASPHAVKRFQREARAAGRLHHTNIVPVYGMGQDAGYWYYAMELVHGKSLSRAITELKERGSGGQAGTPLGGGPDRYPHVARKFAGVADALQLAHDEGIIHRDVKPSNLLLDTDGELKIVDFGLARVDDGTPAFTVTQGILGTPVYMSPEQALGKRDALDHRTDVYSLGATLYEALTLKPPFSGKGVAEICTQIATEDPVPPRRVDPRIPGDLETIVAKAMEKEPSKRYATAADLAADLRRFAEGAAIEARPLGPFGRLWRRARRHRLASALVSAIVLLAAVGGAFALRAASEASRRRDLEYARLEEEAGQAMARAIGEATLPDAAGGDEPSAPDTSAAEAFGRMIALDGGRAEAYLGRALAPGRTLEERRRDLDLAEARGLPRGTAAAARAYVLAETWTGTGGPEQAAPAEAAFAAAALAARGEDGEALAFAERAVAGSERGTIVHLLALHTRALLLERAGDCTGALRDLHEVQGAGGGGMDVKVHVASLWARIGEGPDAAERPFARILEETRAQASPAAWAALCRACRRHGLAEWHARALEEARKEFPADDAVTREASRAEGAPGTSDGPARR